MNNKRKMKKKKEINQAWWLMSVIPATWQAEIDRVTFKADPGEKFARPPSHSLSYG
jgi:hypothetical protein